MHTHVLIIGASSAIALECAREYARQGVSLCITARTNSQLEVLKADLLSYKAARVECLVFDALTEYTQRDLIAEAVQCLGSLDAILIAYGSLPDQEACSADVEKTMHEFHLNASSVISLCTSAAMYFEKNIERNKSQNIQPCLAVISSVAGDRGRQSNYLYGAAKGAVSLYLQGLRNRLYHLGIHVLTIKPGFVDTPMTAHLPKNALFASARSVGRKIFQSMERGSDVVYVPSFWRYIMFVVRHIPESIFKTMKL